MPEATLRRFLQAQLPAAPAVRGLVVGFSGGLDSRVLLQAAACVAGEFGLSLRAVHVHHGLSPQADAWAAQAERWCAQAGVPLCVQRVQVAPGPSLEAAARTARYAAFAATLQPDEALLLAQHRDDQAETLLFRLLRGAGLTGLGAMRPVRRLPLPGGGAVVQWRPFLGLSRQVLQDYARARGLDWVQDESNQDCRHARNFLRHEILPRLQTRWPAVQATLAATAARLQEAEQLLQELAAELAAAAVDAEQRLRVEALQALSRPRQKLLLRFWLQQQGFLPPEEALVERMLDEVAAARADATPCLRWRGGELRRYRGWLYALRPRPAVPADWACEWSGRAPLALPDGRWLVAEGVAAQAGPWQVRYRRGGERLRRPGGPARELKTLLQEAGVPPWERARLPLVFRGDELVAVPGLAGTALRFSLHAAAPR